MISQRAQLTFSLVDASDSIGNMSLWLADGVDLDTAAAAAATFRGLMAGCSDAVFTRQAVVYGAVEAPRPTANPGADGTRTGVFIFSAGDDQFGIIEVPGIIEAALVASGAGAGLLIDQAHPAIAALIEQLVSGLWCNPFGHTLAAVDTAYLQIRR